MSFIVLCTSKDKMLPFTFKHLTLCTRLVTVLNTSFIREQHPPSPPPSPVSVSPSPCLSLLLSFFLSRLYCPLAFAVLHPVCSLLIVDSILWHLWRYTRWPTLKHTHTRQTLSTSCRQRAVFLLLNPVNCLDKEVVFVVFLILVHRGYFTPSFYYERRLNKGLSATQDNPNRFNCFLTMIVDKRPYGLGCNYFISYLSPPS